MEENKLTIKAKPPTFKKGIALRRQQNEQTINEIDPKTLPNRLGLVFDDSGSMSGDAIENAHSAVKNFTSCCSFQDTSIALYPLNQDNKPLTVDYDILNMYVMGLNATGGTPLYTVLLKMYENEDLTRAVVFSDGSPTDSKLVGFSESWDSKPKDFAVGIISKYKSKEIPIDTIYIGIKESSGYREMEEIARLTGGIFIHFTDSMSLNQNLKYLAPRYRALLANPEIKAKIERGERI